MANEQFVSRYRKYGEEQPYWKAGIFKIRLPFFHYKPTNMIVRLHRLFKILFELFNNPLFQAGYVGL